MVSIFFCFKERFALIKRLTCLRIDVATCDSAEVFCVFLGVVLPHFALVVHRVLFHSLQAPRAPSGAERGVFGLNACTV